MRDIYSKKDECTCFEDKNEEQCRCLFEKTYRYALEHYFQKFQEVGCCSKSIDKLIDILQYEWQEYNYGLWIMSTLYLMLQKQCISKEDVKEAFEGYIVEALEKLLDMKQQHIWISGEEADANIIIKVYLAYELYELREFRETASEHREQLQKSVQYLEEDIIPLIEKSFEPCYTSLQEEMAKVREILNR